MRILNDTEVQEEVNKVLANNVYFNLVRQGITRDSIVAKIQHRQDMKGFIEWGDEPCPHVSHYRGKHWCGECWESLKVEVSNDRTE